MKVASPYRVRIVLEPDFGEQLGSLPFGEPVWIVATPANESVAHRLSKERPTAYHLTGITIFKSHDLSQPEREFLGILKDVDLHHGEYSAHPPYSILEVVGCTPSDEIHSALAEFDFSVTSVSPNGFVAERCTQDR